ncbi:MAG: hypothetical protein ACKVOJ_12740 [Sphingomonadaceae bacterium]
MRVIALVDLDDTLFQTIRKCPPDVPADLLSPLGFAKDGSPLSYATPHQFEFVNWLVETTHFVPVTARGLDALRRVRIPFGEAVCAHGGVILRPDGTPDLVWAAHIAQQVAVYTPTLNALALAVRASASQLGVQVSVRVLDEDGVGLYVLVKQPDSDVALLNKAVDAMVDQLPSGWTDHRNGNNIALMPPFLGKAHAVAHILPDLRARFPLALVIGIGDSLTDAPFMQLCDFAVTPTQSQLATAFFGAVT